MTTGLEILNSFRAERRQSEYEVLIEVLPDVLCDIVLNYAQLDNGILKRIHQLNVYTSHTKIRFIKPQKNITNQLYFMVESVLSYDMVYSSYNDIFASCYREPDAEFTRDIAIATTYKLNSEKYSSWSELSMSTYRDAIDQILWPILSEEESPRSQKT